MDIEDFAFKSPKDIKKLRVAFRIQFNKFTEDYERIGKELRQMTLNVDTMLDAMGELLK